MRIPTVGKGNKKYGMDKSVEEPYHIFESEVSELDHN